MVPRPSSPTSLLWAYQLKSEHEHLLNRLKDIAKSHEAYEAKLDVLEKSNEGMKGSFAQLEDMATWISAIEKESQDIKELVRKLHGERQIKLEGGIEKFADLAGQVAALHSHTKDMGIEIRRTLYAYPTIIKKIEDIEAKIQKQGKTEMLRKDDPLDAVVFTRRLDAIESHRDEDSTRTKILIDRMETLEQANKKLSTSYAQFQAQIKLLNDEAKKQQRVARGTRIARTELDLEQVSSPSSFQPSHSPRAANPSQSVLRKHNLLEDSQDLDAQLGRSARISQQFCTERLGLPMHSEITALDSIVKEGNIYAKIIPEAANLRRKREVARSLDSQQMTNAPKLGMRSTVPISNPSEDSLPSFKHLKATQTFSKSERPQPGLPPQKRKRRQIPQAQDLDSFALMANYSHM